MVVKDERESVVCQALRPFGTTIFTEMTALANEAGAINLSQGFPDFDGPAEIRQAAADAIMQGPNQYAPSSGTPQLRQAVAAKMKRFYDLDVDADDEVTVTAGATEGLAATLFGLIEPGDEVILLEPCYDIYAPLVARSGATAVHVSLQRPGFGLPQEALTRAFGPRTRAIIVNTPQNPCGKVFTRQELEWIGALCQEHNAFALGDEVYEHLVYGGAQHTSLLQVPVLKDRAVVISSTAKTFSMTGWKVGYAIATAPLTKAVRMSHQFLTFCTPPALQNAMALAMGMDDSYYEDLLASYTDKRERLCDALDDIGFAVIKPEGTYYASINIESLDFADDLVFCKHLIAEYGVAAIPSSFFWNQRSAGKDLVRFCFCKTDETLDKAIERLKRWKR